MGASPKILNVEELATLWHFPSLLVKSPLVKKAEAKRGEPPVGLPIGSNEDHHVAYRPMASHADIEHHGAVDNHAVASHAEEPEIHVPASTEHAEPESHHATGSVTSSHADVEAPVVHVPSARPSSTFDEDMEVGLDATDMGPPADVELPGPPPGWKEEDTPPNLPV